MFQSSIYTFLLYSHKKSPELFRGLRDFKLQPGTLLIFIDPTGSWNGCQANYLILRSCCRIGSILSRCSGGIINNFVAFKGGHRYVGGAAMGAFCLAGQIPG
jgi:hypothetical protein